jgi:hypothetical protein
MKNGICHWGRKVEVSRKMLGYADCIRYEVPITSSVPAAEIIPALQAALTRRNSRPLQLSSYGASTHTLVGLEGRQVAGIGNAVAIVEVEINIGD